MVQEICSIKSAALKNLWIENVWGDTEVNSFNGAVFNIDLVNVVKSHMPNNQRHEKVVKIVLKGRYKAMKRKFLEDLGLEKDAIDSIMDENGKDIEAAKSDTKALESQISTLESENATLKSQVTDRDAQLETLKNSTGDVEAMKAQIAQLQADNTAQMEAHNKEMKQVKIDAAIDLALTNAKAKNTKAVKALLELGEDVDIDDKGVVKGLDDAIKKLQGAEDSKFLFDTETKKTQVKGAKPGESGNDEGDHGVDTSKMTYSEMTAYLAENPDAKI